VKDRALRILTVWGVLAVSAFFLVASVHAARLVCDPYGPGPDRPTHFGVILDSLAPVEVPAAIDEQGNAALDYSLVQLGAGPHTAKAWAIQRDPVFGDRRSSEASVNFTVPDLDAALSAPGLRLAPSKSP
jgi:hypothetical protein